MSIKIICGDSLVELKKLSENSVDSICCDPPYGLSFMGKKWDYDVPSVEMWKEALRVLKPGGHLLSFGGSRTYHRMAVAIEDAGFEIRDQIMYVYGQGFPKALDVNKKLGSCVCGGNAVPYNHEEAQHNLRLMQDRDIPQAKPIDKEQGEVLQSSLSEQSIRTPIKGQEPEEGSVGREERSVGRRQLHRTREGLQDDTQPESPQSKAERLRLGTLASDGADDRQTLEKARGSTSHQQAEGGQQTGKPEAVRYALRPLDGESLSRCSRCKRPILQSGIKTALKPSHEPIVLARKPLSESTIALNVLRWGTGGINIDGCRVGTEEMPSIKVSTGFDKVKGFGKGATSMSGTNKVIVSNQATGRFPANFIHDGSDEVVGLFPDTGKSTGGNSGVRGNDVYGKYGDSQLGVNPGFGDSGSAARFFYCAKASKKDRNEGLEGFEEKQTTGGGGLTAGFREDGSYETASAGGKYGSIKAKQTNSHPTVKPTALMQYLVRFVTPVGGTVLDCFMGSGSTGKACVLEGFDFIGIEIEKEYCDIATARIAFLQEKKLNKPLLI